jgi:hypothetical protein
MNNDVKSASNNITKKPAKSRRIKENALIMIVIIYFNRFNAKLKRQKKKKSRRFKKRNRFYI